jgi:hypothetical protein
MPIDRRRAALTAALTRVVSVFGGEDNSVGSQFVPLMPAVGGRDGRVADLLSLMQLTANVCRSVKSRSVKPLR